MDMKEAQQLYDAQEPSYYWDDGRVPQVEERMVERYAVEVYVAHVIEDEGLCCELVKVARGDCEGEDLVRMIRSLWSDGLEKYMEDNYEMERNRWIDDQQDF